MIKYTTFDFEPSHYVQGAGVFNFFTLVIANTIYWSGAFKKF